MALAHVLETPALVVDWSIVERNVQRMATLARRGPAVLRPHAKTHKLPQLARLQMTAGAVGVTVATLREARVMAEAGVRDLLVAYPLVGTAKVLELLKLAELATVSVALDSREAADEIARYAAGSGRTFGLLIEVDTGLGRCGLRDPATIVDLALTIADAQGVEFAGIMTHEGHAYQSSDEAEMRRTCDVAVSEMAAVADHLRSAGLAPGIVSMGSSATARFVLGSPGVSEFRPGTYVYNDLTQVALGAAAMEDCAATVVATVVSKARRDEAVVDAGSKALSSDRSLVASSAPTFGVVLSDPRCKVVRLSEEHGVLAGGDVGRLRVGDRVAIVPNHVCPVVNLFDDIEVVVDGRLERWGVPARGHSRST